MELKIEFRREEKIRFFNEEVNLTVLGLQVGEPLYINSKISKKLEDFTEITWASQMDAYLDSYVRFRSIEEYNPPINAISFYNDHKPEGYDHPFYVVFPENIAYKKDIRFKLKSIKI